MDCKAIPIGELLPHGPEMTLIDRLVEYAPQRSVATVDDRRETAGSSPDRGVPAWVGIEYMAQTIAAHAGYEARLRGEPPAIGFLLGTRAYRSEVGEFPLGAALTISVEPLVADAKLGAFQCSIAIGSRARDGRREHLSTRGRRARSRRAEEPEHDAIGARDGSQQRHRRRDRGGARRAGLHDRRPLSQRRRRRRAHGRGGARRGRRLPADSVRRHRPARRAVPPSKRTSRRTAPITASSTTRACIATTRFRC